ncbi:VPS9 domain-containing protein, partial [Caerostris extrusa]
LEETAYNDDYKPYRILITENPLCSSKIKDEFHCTNSSKNGLVLSLNECTTFLRTFPECTEVLNTLDRKIQVFNSSYIVLPQYLQDASVKLRGMLNWAVTEFSVSLQYRTTDEYSKTDISAALENYISFKCYTRFSFLFFEFVFLFLKFFVIYIMGHAHDKVFPVIKKFCFEEDEKLTQKLLSLYEADITSDQLGVRESFCCQTPSAVVELASLNSRKSPAEKLNCFMTTLELLNQDIEQFLLETCYPVSNKDTPCLTSDDLIPLLVNVIIQARPQYFVSNLYYIQNFCWENSPVDKISFGLVTFQAAKEFLKSNEFEFLKPSNRKIKKRVIIRRIDGSSYNQQSGVDSRPKENVGDFLSSLRQSSLGHSYGKQT